MGIQIRRPDSRAFEQLYIGLQRGELSYHETGATIAKALPAGYDHEAGEERFTVEANESGQIWYRIRAFSRPALWIARLGYPLARQSQRCSVRDSLYAMLQKIQSCDEWSQKV